MNDKVESYLHIETSAYSAPGPRDVHDDMPGLTALEVIEGWKQHSERVEAERDAAIIAQRQTHDKWLSDYGILADRCKRAEAESAALRERVESLKTEGCEINRVIRERMARLEEAIRDATGGHEYWDRNISTPEDIEVFALCERHGYGAVMDSASRLWARKDPKGSFVVGTCRVFARRALAALAQAAPRTEVKP